MVEKLQKILRPNQCCGSGLGSGSESGSKKSFRNRNTGSNHGYGSSLRSNPDIYQKYKMGDISKGVANPV